MPSIVDCLAVIILVMGAFQGYRRRFSGELARFISTILVFVVGVILYRPIGIWLQAHSRLEGRGAMAVGFLAMLLLGILISTVVFFVVKRLVRLVLAEPGDKFLGTFAGLLRAVLFVLLVFILMNLWPHEYVNRIFGEESMIGRVVVRCLPDLDEMMEEAQVKAREVVEENEE